MARAASVRAIFGTVLRMAVQPEPLQQMLKLIQELFDSAITCGGLTAILLDLLLPREQPPAEIAADALWPYQA